MIFVPWLQAARATSPAGGRLPRARAVDPLGRHGLHGHLGAPRLRACSGRARLRAFSSHRHDVQAASRTKADDPMDAIETPSSWFFVGPGRSASPVSRSSGTCTFDMPYWQTLIAVLLSFALALVACRVTGETDTTPVGAMGKITQLTFGAVSPGNMNVNLMSANITAAAAGASADLLTDLKSGYLLGAHPRKQFIAQFAGIFIGTLVPVLAFNILVPNASVLGTDQFPAPAAQTWKGVAEALAAALGRWSRSRSGAS